MSATPRRLTELPDELLRNIAQFSGPRGVAPLARASTITRSIFKDPSKYERSVIAEDVRHKLRENNILISTAFSLLANMFDQPTYQDMCFQVPISLFSDFDSRIFDFYEKRDFQYNIMDRYREIIENFGNESLIDKCMRRAGICGFPRIDEDRLVSYFNETIASYSQIPYINASARLFVMFNECMHQSPMGDYEALVKCFVESVFGYLKLKLAIRADDTYYKNLLGLDRMEAIVKRLIEEEDPQQYDNLYFELEDMIQDFYAKTKEIHGTTIITELPSSDFNMRIRAKKPKAKKSKKKSQRKASRRKAPKRR